MGLRFSLKLAQPYCQGIGGIKKHSSGPQKTIILGANLVNIVRTFSTNEFVQGITERNVFTKFEENLSDFFYFTSGDTHNILEGGTKVIG